MKNICLRRVLPVLLLCYLVCAVAPAQTAADTVAARRDTSSYSIREATVTATRLVFVMKKDTVVYDIDALQASRGDMLGDIIAKMPGLELRDGVLYFKGRAVNRVLVNGTDFVRGDTQQALSNLPAYIIKSVKAYEGQTDIARITGIDDGEKEQVIDIILRREYLGTWTGNADVAGGTDYRWLMRGFGNTFTDRFRASVYGGFANTGQYQGVSDNGEWQQNGGTGSSSGDTRYMKPGFSLMWKNRAEEKGAGFFKVEAGGNWDFRRHDDRGRSESEYYLDDGTSLFEMDRSRSRNDEKIWSGRLYFTWKPTEKTHVEFGPNYSYRTFFNRSREEGGRWDQPVASRFPSPIDSLLQAGGEGWPDGGAVFLNRKAENSGNYMHRYSHWLYATHKLTDNNWRLSLRNSLSANYQSDRISSLTEYRYYRPEAAQQDPLYNRYKRQHGNNFNVMNFADLYIPLKFFQTLRFTYGYTGGHNSNNIDGYRLDRLGGLFADYDNYLTQMGTLPTETDWQLLARDADISLNSTTDEHKHWAEGYLQYNRHGLYTTLQLLTRFAHDEMYYCKDGYEPLTPSRNSREYVVHTQWRYTSDSIGTFDFRYYYEVTPQSLSYSIDIPDRSDPLSVRLGNPGLRDNKQHRLSLKYDRTLRGSRSLAGDASWSVRKNSVTMRSTYDKATGVTTLQPTTVSGTWTASAALHFNTPLDRGQRFTYNVSARYFFSHRPTFTTGTAGAALRRTDDAHNLAVSMGLNGRLNKFFGTVNVYSRYTLTRSEALRKSTYENFYGHVNLSVQYQLPAGIELKTNAKVRYLTGSNALSYDPWRTVWGASVTRSFLRDKSLALLLECSDLLNQRSGTYAYSDAAGRGSGWNYNVGRTLMLHVIYRFSTKKD